jgi:type II secretion system protein G
VKETGTFDQMKHSRKMSEKPAGFTLIELLIVVAIIAILAAIAVPNFIEAQTRAKVSRVKSDLRTLATAIESYYVDHGTYPPDGDDTQFFDFDVMNTLRVITTPIAYASSLPFDPFNTEAPKDASLQVLFPGDPPYTYVYNTFGNSLGINLSPVPGPTPPDNNGLPDNYGLSSPGPSRSFDSATVGFPLSYDPSNGTISNGDIHRFGGARTPLTPDP